MPQTSTHFTVVASKYITPTSCPDCGGNARLVRRSNAITGDGKGEIRSYECSDCKALTEMFIRD